MLVDRLGLADGDDDNVRPVWSGAIDTARRKVGWGVQLPQNDFHSGEGSALALRGYRLVGGPAVITRRAPEEHSMRQSVFDDAYELLARGALKAGLGRGCGHRRQKSKPSRRAFYLTQVKPALNSQMAFRSGR